MSLAERSEPGFLLCRDCQENGQLSLHLAARAGAAQSARFLLEHGADIRVKDEARPSPVLPLLALSQRPTAFLQFSPAYG